MHIARNQCHRGRLGGNMLWFYPSGYDKICGTTLNWYRTFYPNTHTDLFLDDPMNNNKATLKLHVWY